MKKIITFLALGLMFSCSVEELPDTDNIKVADLSAQCEGFTAGPDASSEIELSDAKAIPSIDEARKLFVKMLAPGVPTKGTYNPTIKQIVASFNSGDMLGDYSTVYTVSNADGCTDSTNLTLRVIPDKQDEPICEISAGNDTRFEITVSEADAIPSFDEARKLYLNSLDQGIPRTGTFSPTMKEIVAMYNSGEKIGEYPTTYTIKNETCSDSAILTLVVVKDPVVCNVNAGNDMFFEMEVSDVEAIPSVDEARKLFISKLETSVAKTGTFSPTIKQLIEQFNGGNKIGQYTTTYTLVDGECSDSATITLNVIPDAVEEPVCSISAGADKVKTITLSQAKALPSVDEVKKLYLSMLDSGVKRNGSFDPTIKTLIARFNSSSNNIGDYTTTYTVVDGDCKDSTQLTLRVIAD